jgi:hypothetical protein
MFRERASSPPTIIQFHVRPQTAHQVRAIVALSEQFPGPLTIVLYHRGTPVILYVEPCSEVLERLEILLDERDLLLEMCVWKTPAHP